MCLHTVLVACLVLLCVSQRGASILKKHWIFETRQTGGMCVSRIVLLRQNCPHHTQTLTETCLRAVHVACLVVRCVSQRTASILEQALNVLHEVNWGHCASHSHILTQPCLHAIHVARLLLLYAPHMAGHSFIFFLCIAFMFIIQMIWVHHWLSCGHQAHQWFIDKDATKLQHPPEAIILLFMLVLLPYSDRAYEFWYVIPCLWLIHIFCSQASEYKAEEESAHPFNLITENGQECDVADGFWCFPLIQLDDSIRNFDHGPCFQANPHFS